MSTGLAPLVETCVSWRVERNQGDPQLPVRKAFAFQLDPVQSLSIPGFVLAPFAIDASQGYIISTDVPGCRVWNKSCPF